MGYLFRICGHNIFNIQFVKILKNYHYAKTRECDSKNNAKY